VTGARSATVIVYGSRVLPRRAAISAPLDPDRVLVERAKAGDGSAFEELIARHQRSVYSLVSRMIFSREEADDVASEVFLLAFQNIRRFRGEAAFGTWLYKIAVNLSLKRIKRLSRMKTVSLEEVKEKRGDSVLEDEASEPAEDAERSDSLRLIRSAITALSPKHQAVVTLHYFCDMNCEQIADLLGCSVGTVWSRLHYAMKRLKIALQERGIGPEGIGL
jgi:RNA polymerase sigma-70 factor (ECF subfamily)